MDKSPDAFRTISEVADWLDTPAHVLRFWESKFSQIKPVKRAGGRRYYRPSDMLLIGGIKRLLHEDGMTIRGVQKLLREESVKHVMSFSKPLDNTRPEASEPGDTTVDSAERAQPAPIAENVAPAEDPVVSITRASASDEKAARAKTDSFEKSKPLPPLFPEMEDDAAASQDIVLDPDMPAAPMTQSTETTTIEASSGRTGNAATDTPPAPLGQDVPGDDVDESEFPTDGISRVAASLRQFGVKTNKKRPDPEILTELYIRMVKLKSRMDDTAFK